MTRHELELIQDYLIDHVQTVEFPGTEQKFRYIPTSAIDVLENHVEDNDLAKSTIVSNDITMDDIVSILADGFAGGCAFEKVDYDENEYYQAKEALIKEGFNKDALTLELVQTKMLMMGFSLQLKEVDTTNWHDLTLAKLLNALNAEISATQEEWHCTRLHALVSFFNEGDFYTFEGVIQRAIFGEVIYG